MRRRVVFNQKGGVGKTSITCNLAAIGAARGSPTLVVDLDPQGNTSQYLLGSRYDETNGGVGAYYQDCLSFRLLERDPFEYVDETDFDDLHLITSSPVLNELEPKLQAKHKIYKLRDLLRDLEDDFAAVFIDTPPAFNFFTLSALIAADSCLIPFDCDDFSRRALYQLLENVAETRSDHNRDLQVEGIIINQFLPRANLPRRLVEELCQDGLPVLESHLSSSVKMRESHEQATPLVHLAPKHKLTEQYIALYDELTHAA